MDNISVVFKHFLNSWLFYWPHYWIWPQIDHCTWYMKRFWVFSRVDIRKQMKNLLGAWLSQGIVCHSISALFRTKLILRNPTLDMKAARFWNRSLMNENVNSLTQFHVRNFMEFLCMVSMSKRLIVICVR